MTSEVIDSIARTFDSRSAHVRFSWGLGPDGVDSPIKGTDFAVVRDGRIRSITGFLDQVPQGA
jgi:hypothetical protein